MKPVFADTSYWIALIVKGDELRSAILRATSKLRGRHIVTTEYVLAELLNDLSGRGTHIREAGVTLARSWIGRGQEEFVAASIEKFAQAVDLYANRPDKSWSLTDCTSIVICEQRGITEVLTHDRHFEQAGFTALLREDT